MVTTRTIVCESLLGKGVNFTLTGSVLQEAERNMYSMGSLKIFKQQLPQYHLINPMPGEMQVINWDTIMVWQSIQKFHLVLRLEEVVVEEDLLVRFLVQPQLNWL